MKYAIVYHSSILGGSTKVEVWDAATVALADRYAPDWQVYSWHDDKASACAAMADVDA